VTAATAPIHLKKRIHTRHQGREDRSHAKDFSRGFGTGARCEDKSPKTSGFGMSGEYTMMSQGWTLYLLEITGPDSRSCPGTSAIPSTHSTVTETGNEVCEHGAVPITEQWTVLPEVPDTNGSAYA